MIKRILWEVFIIFFFFSLIFIFSVFSDAGLTDALNVTLGLPANNSVIDTKDVNFTFYVEWNESMVIANCTLYGNFTGEWAANKTNQTEIVRGENWIYLTDLQNGVYEWNVYCYNETENIYEYAVTNFTFTVKNPCQVYIDSLPYSLTQNNTYYCLNKTTLNLNTTAIQFDSFIQNSTLDCRGFFIDGNDASVFGIYLDKGKNNTIKNCYVRDFMYGIFLRFVMDTKIINSYFGSNSWIGIWLVSADQNWIINSTSTENQYYGIYLQNSTNNQIINSKFDGNFDEGIRLNTSSRNEIINSSFSNNIYGIYSLGSSANYLKNLTIKNNKYGIYFGNSSRTVLDGLLVSNNTYYGIAFHDSAHNVLVNSSIKDNPTIDLQIYVSSPLYCNNYLENVIGSDEKPIKFFNSSTNLENETISELILCNASGSNISNITLKPSSLLKNNGILIYYTENSTLSKVNSSFVRYGVYLYNSSLNKIEHSTFINNSYAIYVVDSISNKIINSVTENNSFSGLYFENSHYNELINLTSNFNFHYGLYLSSSDYNRVNNLNCSKNGRYGAFFHFSSGNYILNSFFNSNSYGIYLSSSSLNHINNSRFDSNQFGGLYLESGSNNTLANLLLSANEKGILIHSSEKTIIVNSSLINNSYGVYLENCVHSLLANNKFLDNEFGIYIYQEDYYFTENNTIYNNLFNNSVNLFICKYDPSVDGCNNTYELYPYSPTNYFNITRQTGARIYSPGKEIGGNYWTDPSGNGYSDTCSDNNKDGFCDSPYLLDSTGKDTDYYPLSNKYEIYCGNGYCETGETCSSCPRDCGTCPSGGAGPGPGAGAPLTTVSTTPGKAVIFIPLIAAMSKANVSIQKTEGIDFTQIVISVRNRVTSVQINITKLDEKPEEVPALANVYRYIRVDKKNIHDENITEVKLRFRVQKSWINSNNIKLDSIALYRYTYRWEKLNTLRIGEDSEDIYFEASSPGLSYFAIAGEKSKQTCPYECCIGEAEYYDKACTSGYKCENHACIPIVTPCTEDWVCSEWTACIEGKQTRVCTDRNRCGTVANKPEEERSCEEKPEEEKLPTLVFWLGIIIVFLAISLIAKIVAEKLQPKVKEIPKPKERPKRKVKKK